MAFSSGSLTCPNCKAPVHESSKFCNACGRRLPNNSPNEQTANKLYAASIDGMKQCPFCAEDIKLEAIKCRYCGSMLSRSVSVAKGSFQHNPASIDRNAQRSSYESPLAARNNEHALAIKWPLIICGALVVIACALGYLFFSEKRSAEVSKQTESQHSIATTSITTEQKNAPFAGKWGDQSANGDAALFLFIQQEGNSIKAWYMAKDPVKHGTDESTDLTNPGIIGTIQDGSAHLNFHSPSGAAGTAMLKLAENKLLWTIDKPEPSVLNKADVNYSECFLPDLETLQKGLEPSPNYWDNHLLKKAAPSTAEAKIENKVENTAQPPADPTKQCRDFVSKFYNSDWQADGKPHPNSFSPELFKLLNEDYIASKKPDAKGDSLDFDPVLNSNDGKAERYVLGKSTAKNNRYFIEVYGVLNGKTNKQPSVVPELCLKDGKWLFVNFGYPKNGNIPANNLVNLLNQLAKDRQKFGSSVNHNKKFDKKSVPYPSSIGRSNKQSSPHTNMRKP